MTTVKDVLIYEAIERNREYKEERKKKILSDKVQVKIEKWNIASRERTKTLLSREKSRIASWVKTSNLTKKVKKGILIGWRKKKTKTRSQLVKELDTIFSRYIRLRDADNYWMCSCITCWDKKPRKEMQNCHFRSRSCYKYRWSESNCWAWCCKCNVMLHWNYIQYTLVMIDKFWKQRVENIMNDKELIKISTVAIKDCIELYKLKVIELEKSLAIAK